MCKYTNNLYISKYIFILFLFFTKYGKYINLIYRYLYLFLQLCIFKYSFFHNYVYLKIQYIVIIKIRHNNNNIPLIITTFAPELKTTNENI